MKKKSFISIAVALAILLCLTYTVFVLLEKVATGFWSSTSKIHCYSGEQVTEKTESFFRWHVPETATNLYFAHDSGLDIHSFFALTLSSKEECKEFLQLRFNASIPDFQRSSELPEKYLSGPGGGWDWSIEYKKNWDISEYNEYYVYDDYDMQRLEIVYVPKHFRIFIFKDYPD